MRVLERLGSFVAEGRVAPATAARLGVHLLDSVGAMLAGEMLPEARELRTLAAAGLATPGNALDRVALRVGITRATEIDDIHMPSCTTCGAIVVPTALTLAASLREAGKRVEPADLAAALQAGYGVMTWLGTALDGPSLLYRGIWPTYLLAPLGAAAVAARLMRLDAEQASHALAVALCRISGGPGAHGGAHAAGASPRWLLVGQAARAGALAALAASEGFAGDLGLLDAPWLERVHGIVPVGLATAVPEDGGVGGLSLKPVCAAKQTQAALDGCRQILASTPADRIARVEIGVPAAYRAMIGHRRVDSRTDRLTSLAYLLAIAAVAPDDLFDLARARRGDEPAVADFMARVEVAADPSLEPFYPKVWPARVRVTVGGAVIERLVTAALGDPDRPLDEPAAIAKVSRLLGAARPAAALARLTGAALAATHDEAALNDLLAALS